MNGKTPDIEQLLRAAAQQGPEPASPAEKQRAWEQLRKMLDDQPAPPPKASRDGWWWLLAEAVLLLCVGLLFFFSSGGVKDGENNRPASGKVDSQGVPGDNKQVGNSSGKPETQNISGEVTGVKDEKNNLSTSDAQDIFSGDRQQSESDSGADVRNENNNPPNVPADNKTSVKDGKTDRSVPGKAGPQGISGYKKGDLVIGVKDGETNRSTSGKTNSKNIPGNNKKPGKNGKDNRSTSEEAYLQNVPDNQKQTEDDPEKFIFDLQPVYPGIPSQKNLNAGNRRILPRTVEQRAVKFSPVNLKAAIMAANNQSWAANLQAEYTFQLSRQFVIRPSLGVTYLSGAKNSYEHFYRIIRPSDTAGGALPFTVDTASTKYTLKSTLHGGLGLQLVYSTGKWSAYAGAAYQYQLLQKGKDSTVSGSYPISRDSLPHYPAFQPNRLPGRNFLQVQAGVDYQLSPSLRVGLQYNFGWKRDASGGGFVGDIPAYPNRQNIELHIRYFFRKKE